MNEYLAGLKEFCGIYLDDIIVYSTCVKQYLGYFHAVSFCLLDHMLSVKCPKCDFLKSSLNFLVHVILHSGVVLDPSKVSGIHYMVAPTDVPKL